MAAKDCPPVAAELCMEVDSALDPCQVAVAAAGRLCRRTLVGC